MKKLYCKVIFDHGSTLVRVDNLKEFNEVFPNKVEFERYFSDLLKNKIGQGNSFIPKPYEVLVTKEKFDLLAKIIKQKLGSIDNVAADKINLVFNSHSYPVLQIKSI